MLPLFSGGEDSDPGEEVPELSAGGDAAARFEREGGAGDEEQGRADLPLPGEDQGGQ